MTNIAYENYIRAAKLQRSAAIGALIATVVVALWRAVRTRLRPRPAMGLTVGPTLGATVGPPMNPATAPT